MSPQSVAHARLDWRGLTLANFLAACTALPSEAVARETIRIVGATEVTEIAIGMDALAVVRSAGSASLDLSRAQLYRALASEVEREISPDGYLALYGLVALDDVSRNRARDAALGLEPIRSAAP